MKLRDLNPRELKSDDGLTVEGYVVTLPDDPTEYVVSAPFINLDKEEPDVDGLRKLLEASQLLSGADWQANRSTQVDNPYTPNDDGGASSNR